MRIRKKVAFLVGALLLCGIPGIASAQAWYKKYDSTQACTAVTPGTHDAQHWCTYDFTAVTDSDGIDTSVCKNLSITFVPDTAGGGGSATVNPQWCNATVGGEDANVCRDMSDTDLDGSTLNALYNVSATTLRIDVKTCTGGSPNDCNGRVVVHCTE